MIDTARLASRLRVEEKRVYSVYKDSLGYWTIADGILVDKRKGGKLYDNECDFITQNRIAMYYEEIAAQPWMTALAGDDIRQLALLDMYYQLRHHLFGFVKTLGLIMQKDFKGAGASLRKSLWYKQTPNRAEPIIQMIETGGWIDPR